MSEPKTKATTQNALDFINKIDSEQKRQDSLRLIEIFKEITGKSPVMWGTSIIGFDKYHYKSDRSSQEGDWPMVGFSPRKQSLSLYVLVGNDREEKLLKKLGKHKVGKGCLYVNKLSDIDLKILEDLIKNSYGFMKEKYQ